VDGRLLRGSGGKDSRKKIKKDDNDNTSLRIERLLKDSFSMGSRGRGRNQGKRKRYKDEMSPKIK